MISTELVLLILGTIFNTSIQEPLILRSNYKGLVGILPSAQIFASGLNRVAYYHEQTVAVVDIDRNNEIHDCDIVEGYEPQEIHEILQNLSSTVRPTQVSFLQMTGLMSRCEQFDRMHSTVSELKDTGFGLNALNFFHGILPGTKWCGTGDVARDYHDLGPKAEIDRCCRTHDLCPVKIRAQRTRYNLTNNSLYSKSHCMCDIALYQCLKNDASRTAEIMGILYFNVARVECIADVSSNVEGTSSRTFSTTSLRF